MAHEVARAVCQGAVGWQDGLAIAATEVDRASVAHGHVIELVKHREGKAKSGSGRGTIRDLTEDQLAGRHGQTVKVLVPLTLPFAVSVAVSIWLPAVFKVAPGVKVCLVFDTM